MNARTLPPPRTRRWLQPSVLPGFGLTFGVTATWLSLVVLLPLAALIIRPWEMGIGHFLELAQRPRVIAALQLSFGLAALAAAINLVFGSIIAWVLARVEFPGRRLVDALVDLPFALPTAVAGIALAALYAPNGWFGSLVEPLGIQIAYTPLGILVALTFIGLPFVVRTVQPVLEDLDADVEEAAATLGASRLQVMTRVIAPALAPALLTGFALAFARGVGEYGSVIFIAGNIPQVSEIAPLLIVIRLDEFDYAGAAAIGLMMLVGSFTALLALNLAQRAARRMTGAES